MFRRIISALLCLCMALSSLPLSALAETMPEHSHDYREEVTQEATCTAVGIITYTCDCGDSFTLDTPMVDHTYEAGVCTVCDSAEPSDPEETTAPTETATEPEETTEPAQTESEDLPVSVTLEPLAAAEVGEDGTAEFVLEYVCSTGEPLSFQWQRLDETGFSEAYPEGTADEREAAWEDIPDAVNATFVIREITADNQAEYTRYLYRCAVRLREQQWISTEAALIWVEPEKSEPEATEPETNILPAAVEEEDASPVEDFTYSINADQTVTITKYKGADASVKIPAVIEELPVTTIASAAFAGNTTLQSVVIPDGVTTIADSSSSSGGAFYNCTSLTSVTLPDTLTVLGKYAFFNCKALAEIDIPASVQAINGYAFYGCSAMTQINLHDGLKTIEGYAFYNSGITRLELPDTVTSVSFSELSSKLTYVRWTAGIPVINQSQFYGFNKLETVILPEGVTTIPDGGHETPVGSSYTYYWGAFRDCTALKTVELPSTLTHIGSYAFEGCTSLESIEFGGEGCTIGTNVFEGCTSLKYVKVKDGMTNTGKNLFYRCSSLVEVVLPDSLISIDDSTFYGCSSLQTLEIPTSVKTIGATAFNGCKLLTEITLPQGLETIGSSAFSGTGITRLELPDTVTSVSLSGISSQLTYVRWTAGIPVLGTSEFMNMKKLETAILPEGVTTIPDGGHETPVGSSYTYYWGVFRDCTALKTVELPSTLTYIGSYTFEGCTSLESIEFGAGVREIGQNVFEGCTSLKSVVLSPGLERIGSNAFASCPLQGALAIPDSVTEIGSGAFQNCSGLTAVQLPKMLEIIKSSAFSNCSGLTEISLPAGLKCIESSAFYNCGGITEIELPDGLETIESNAFSNTAITVLELPDSVTSVSLTGLSNQLTHVRWTAGIPVLSGSIFQNSTTLKSIVLPEGVTEIADVKLVFQEYFGGYIVYAYAPFMDCSALESIILPNSLTKIGKEAFSGCSKLSYVQLGKNISSIASDAFIQCPDFTLAVYQGTWGEQWAIDNGKDYVYAGINGVVEVTLDPAVYGGMQMVLETGGSRRLQKIGSQTTYRFSGLEEGTTGKLQIKNTYGDVVLEQEIEITRATALTLPEGLTGSVDLTILDENGEDVTAQATVEWFRTTGESYASGAALKGLPVGRELTAKFRLNEKYGKTYYFPDDVKHTVADGSNVLTVTLDRIPVITVTGTVTDGTVPLVGASVVLAQIVNGKYTIHTTAITDKNGFYEAQIPALDATVTVSAHGYMDQKLTLAAPAENVELETSALEKVTGTEISVAANWIPGVKQGETADVQQFNGLGDLEFAVFNSTQNAAVEYILVQGMTLILADHSAPGDVLRITASSLSGDLRAETVTVTVGADNTADCTLTLKQSGSILMKYAATRNEGVQALIYDASGNRVWMDSVDVKKQEISSGLLADGIYTVVLMGAPRFLNCPQSLTGFAQMGLKDGADYISRTVSVEAGVVASCEIGTVPMLEESRFYYTDPDTTSYITSKSTITAGNFFTLRAQAPIAEKYQDQISDVKWIFELPEGMEYYEGTVSVDGADEVTSEYNEGILTVFAEDPARIVRFCVNATGQGEVTSAAYLEFTYEGTVIRQPVGSATVTIGALDFEITEKTFTPSVTVSGTAAGNAEIRIYDGDVLVGQTQSGAGGYWKLTFELYNPGTLSEHSIYAEMLLPTGTWVRSKTHTVVYQYSPAPVAVSLVSMYMGDSSQPTVVFNFQDPQVRNMSYSVEGGTTFTFVTEFNCEDLSRLSDVKLDVYLSDGTTRTLDTVYSEPMKGFVTSCYFGFDALPVNVAVSYVCDDELIFSGEHWEDIQFTANSFSGMTEDLEGVYLENPGEALAPIVFDPVIEDRVPEDLRKEVNKYNTALIEYLNAEKALLAFSQELYGNITYTDQGITTSGGMIDYEMTQGTVSNISISQKIEEGFEVYQIGDSADEFLLVRMVDNAQTGETEFTIIDTSSDGRGSANAAKYMTREARLSKEFDSANLPEQTGVELVTRARIAEGINADADIVDLNEAFGRVADYTQQILNNFMDIVDESLPKIQKGCETFSKDLWDHNKKLSQEWSKMPSGPAADSIKEIIDLEFGAITKLDKTVDAVKAVAPVLDKVLGPLGPLGDVVSAGFSGAQMHSDSQAWADAYVLEQTTGDPDAAWLKQALQMRMLNNGITFSIAVGELGLLALMAAGAITVAPAVLATLGVVTLVSAVVGLSQMSKWAKFDSEIEEMQRRIKQKYAGGNAGGNGQPARPKIDPSGYIYEAVPSNRLPGVTVTCYEKVTMENIYGDPYDEIRFWDAEEFDQVNPLTTDHEGRYSWDVPEGWWQVKAELDGYETTYSEWLRVPPPQLEVNLGMVSYAAPAITDVFAQPDSVDVSFSKYLQTQTLTEETLIVTVDGQTIPGTIQFLNAEASPANKDQLLASKFRFVPENQLADGAKVTVVVSNKVLSYADVAVEADEKLDATVVTIPETLFAPESVALVYQGEGTIAVQAIPAEIAAGETVQIETVSDLFLKTAEQTVVLDENGCGLIHIEGILPGETEIRFSMSDGRLTAKTRVKILMPGDAGTVGTLNLSQMYVALTKGNTTTLTAEVTPRSLAGNLIWTVEAGSEKILSVDASGKVMALNPGTGYVLVTATDGVTTLTARCRVDVAEPLNIDGIQLGATKATTELYSTNYTEIDVLLKLLQNESTQSANGDSQIPDAKGVAIESARFTDETVAKYFDLIPMDDRRLAIVPTDYAVKNPKEVKGSYKSTVAVTVDGVEHPSEVLTLTVKKSTPKLKVTIPAFNSFQSGQIQEMTITGGTVTEIAVDESKATAKTPAIPDWLTQEGQTLRLNKNAPLKSVSGKVYLNICTEEWRIPAAVTLTVKNTYKTPGLKLSATTVTMTPLAEDSNGVTLKLVPTSKKDTLDSLKVEYITAPEGWSVSPVNTHSGEFTLTADTIATPGKITLNVSFRGTNVTLPLTLTVKNAAVKLKLSKTTVTLNKAVSDSTEVTVTATPADFRLNLQDYTLTDSKGVDRKNSGELEIRLNGGAIKVATTDTTVPNSTYKLSVSAGESKPVVLTIKTIEKDPTVSYKAKGTLDLSFPETTATITPTFKNYSGGFTLGTVTAVDSKKQDASHNFRAEQNGTTISVTCAAETQPGTYTLNVPLTIADGSPVGNTVKVTVKRTAVKLKLSSTKLSLNKLYDDIGEIGVTCTTKGYAFTKPVWDLMDKTGKVTAEGELKVEYINGKLVISILEATDYGATYKLLVRANKDAPATTLTITIPTEAKSNITSSLKAKGSIDVIRDGSAVTLTPTYKNCTVQTAKVEELIFTKTENKVATNANGLFSWIRNDDGTFTITRAKGAELNHSAKYTVTLVTYINGTKVCESKPISLSVKQGSAKLSLTTLKGTMFAMDKHSRGEFLITAADTTLNPITRVEIKDTKYQDRLEVYGYGNGAYYICFADEMVDNSLVGKTITVTLNVFLEGNQIPTKANTTVKLKLTVVK